MGNDRTPVFLGEKSCDDWLGAAARKPGEWLDFLCEKKKDIHWTEEVDRPLAAGWKKRAGE